VELLRDAVSDFAAYPFALPAVRNLDAIDLHPKVTFLVGENGSGKSTLLEAIAVRLGFNAEGGTKNFQFETRGSHSELHQFLRIARGLRKPKDGFFLRAESFFNVATEIEQLGVVDSYGGVSLHEQSHGESFMAVMLNRFGGHGLYILDEPEAALSPQRQLSALVRMHDLVNLESQFIIATHSPIIMAYPDAFIYSCSPRGLERVAYEETEHYRVMRQFILDPKRMLHLLVAAEDGAG
jgi:predicted ATPase